MIYVDANATYPVKPEHYLQVAKLLQEVDGNPSSIHASGRAAKVALEDARGHVAALLGARAQEIVFTSGATEANNLAIQGVVGRHARGLNLPHVVVTATEHSSVTEPAKVLAERGHCRLQTAPVNRAGDVDGDALLGLVTAETVLVCLMHGNNETGAVNPVVRLAKRIKDKHAGVHVHVDAVQVLGKMDLTGYAASAIDSASLSAHKVGGFKGTGALYLRAGAKLSPLLCGGGQERARRPGTENMPGIVSFGIRCQELRGTDVARSEAMRKLRDGWKACLGEIPGVVVHDGAAESLPNTVNFHVDGVPGDDILLNFDLAGIQASSGSACSSSVARPSHVLVAMGYDEWVALNSVRVSFSAEGRPEDLGRMAGVLRDVVKRSRR